MNDLERSPYRRTEDASGNTSRFLTQEIDITSRDAKFNAFLQNNFDEFIKRYPPQSDINPTRAIRTGLQPKQEKLLKDIQAKNSPQLLAEGMVKYLIEKSIVVGFGQRQNLEKIIAEFAKAYNFSLQTQEILNQVLDTYFTNQPIVEDFFKTRNHNPKKAFRDLFGVDMNAFGQDKEGKPLVQVYQGPAGAELFCDKEIVGKVIKYLYSEESEILGFAGVRGVKINGINFPIFYNFNTEGDPRTYFHELGHNWNKMFKYLNRVKEFLTKEEYYNNIFDLIDSKKPSDQAVKEYYQTQIHQALLSFGDELLAKMKSQDTFDDFFDFSDPTNTYDYLRNFRNSNSNSLNIDEDEYYLRKRGYQNFSILKNNLNLSPITHSLYSFDRAKMVQIRQDLFYDEYLPLIKEITDKVKLILDKKPELRKTLIGTLGLYTEIELWPDILDKIISDL